MRTIRPQETQAIKVSQNQLIKPATAPQNDKLVINKIKNKEIEIQPQPIVSAPASALASAILTHPRNLHHRVTFYDSASELDYFYNLNTIAPAETDNQQKKQAPLKQLRFSQCKHFPLCNFVFFLENKFELKSISVLSVFILQESDRENVVLVGSLPLQRRVLSQKQID